MHNAKLALVDGAHAIAAGEQEFSLAELKGSDSSAIAVLLDWQRQAQKKNQNLNFTDIPGTLLSFAAVYGVDTVLNGFTSASVAAPPHNHHHH